MAMLDITVLDQHMRALAGLLPDSTSPEAAAYMLFGSSDIATDPWSGGPRHRLISHQVVEIPATDMVSSSGMHVTWSTRSFMRMLGDAAIGGKIPGIFHTHPGSHAFFSEQDDANERELARTAQQKGARGLVSIVLGGDGSVCGRIWHGSNAYTMALALQIVGGRYQRHQRHLAENAVHHHLDRQRRLFGQGFNDNLSSLRVCVVGCGGTGSPVALLLARLGVGHIFLVDKDVIDETNLNRVHGARRDDIGRAKVEVLKREIELMGVGSRVEIAQDWINAAHVRDALKASDFVFGCTDDNTGRILINRLAHFYGIPVIDVGLRMIAAAHEHGHDLNGRVTTLIPGRPCLICGGVVNATRAQEEELERNQPDEFQRRKAEAYVVGASDPAPAVVTFTTEMASVAVNEMIAAITEFHGADGMIPTRIRRWHVRDDRFLNVRVREGCPVCQSDESRGAGDVLPFLDMAG
ncbi:ThiF family adenylyltransferase [Rhizobium sp. 25PS6]|uniref:ThiF family adenylyltransferase n=1 Tax=Rhizobium sp. 25PS6 TaxID=3075622 RepID=UPI0028FDB14B|nr:ThiF family adenylyltransferase [Rhizobium sp. 25PS6]MDU0364525.1 ThiF family adenylyltransferase [Rhizobium sp. 25PS6]